MRMHLSWMIQRDFDVIFCLYRIRAHFEQQKLQLDW